MKQQNPTTKKAMLEALSKSLGIVTTACKQVGINPSTHYDWLKTDAEYRGSVTEMDNLVLDFAESALMKKVNDGDTTAIIFLLKTKGKKRGYIEKSSIDINIPDEETEKKRQEFMFKINKVKSE